MWMAIALFQSFVIAYFVYITMRESKPKLPTEIDIDKMMPHQFINGLLRQNANERKVADAIEKARDVLGYVYIIKECGLNKYYKIGKTSTIQGRLSALETAMPYPMEVISIIVTSDYDSLELELHRRFSTKRRKNEWFELDDNDIAQIKRIGE
jgi:hypothetical protein